MIIKKEEYVKVVQRPYPPLWSSLILAGATNEIYYKPFLRKPYALRKTIVLDSAWYYWKNADDEGCRVTSEEWKNKKRLNRGIKLLAQEERNLVNSIKKDFKTLCLKFETYMPAVGLTYFAEFFYEQTKKLLKKKISPVKAEELLGWLNIPLRDNFYKKEEYDLVTSKSIKNHVKKYEWILSRYGDDVPYTEKDARQKLLGINRRIFLKKRSDEKRNIKIAIARVKKILGKTNAYLIDGLQFIVFYRTQRTDIINKVAYLYIPYLKKIASKYALSYDELLMCTKDEVINGEIPSKTLLAERANGHAMIVDRNKVLCLVGKEYKALKQIFKEKVKDVEIIGGNVASRGVANGVVKVILSRNDFSKMNKGDILVANMTTPEMIPIMKKAAAFVTDEGGITCHAAIVSREMNRPCIIGTKIATKVLKDGDLVEVDANKGVVRRIK